MSGDPDRESAAQLLQELYESFARLEALSLPPEAQEEMFYLRRVAGKLSAALGAHSQQVGNASKESIQEQTHLISTMTHELRLPLTSIKGYTDLLRNGAAGPLNDHQIGFLGVISQNVDRMTVLLACLSDISKLDSVRLKMNVLPLPVMSHLEQAFRDLYPQLHGKGHRLDVRIPEDTPLVLSDPIRLVQIFTSLIRNACMYTPDQGLICIQAVREDSVLRFSVIDNGIGIKTEEQARLFTPFFRSEDPMVREQQGWGLSLYLVFKLTEAMGGHAGATSTAGEGSRFWVTLPTSPTMENI